MIGNHRLLEVSSDRFRRIYSWIVLQFRVGLWYVAGVVVVSSILLPVVGWHVWLSPIAVGSDLTVPVLSAVFVGITFDPVVLFGGLGLLTVYWRVGRTEYQLRHRLYEDIMLVPLTETGVRHSELSGSRWAVQFKIDRSMVVFGETSGGKTEAIKVLAHQIQADPDEAFVIFGSKQDYHPVFPENNVITLSSQNATVTWNVFEEIKADSEYEEIATAVFDNAEIENDYFTNAAAQVLADVLRLLERRAENKDKTPTNAYLLGYLDGADADFLRKEFEREGLSSKKHLPPDVEASSNIVSILEERVNAVFRDDFAEAGRFSVREYMAAPQGQVLLFDVPIQQSASVQGIFRLLIDWSIRFGFEDDRGSYYILDEFAALPELERLERLIRAGQASNCYAILGVQAIPQLRDTDGRDKTDSLLSGLSQEICLRVGQGSVEYCRKRIDQEHVERNIGSEEEWPVVVNENDKRVVEDYPIGEDTPQNCKTGRSIVHIPAAQRGCFYLLDAINDRLLPADRSELTVRLCDRLHRHPHKQIIEADEQTQPPQLEERSD